jgi:inorganic pyrophosphatase
MSLEMNAIPPRDAGSRRVNVTVDTTAGFCSKYKYDTSLALFRLSRRLPQALVFPHDFGSIPGTCAADGDALDVLVPPACRTRTDIRAACLRTVSPERAFRPRAGSLSIATRLSADR